MTVPYDADKLAGAMERMYDPHLQATMRGNAAQIAKALSDEGVVEWLADSIEQERPVDLRFEDLFARRSSVAGYE